ncbi:MAG: outer membrane beta-barrel protein [Litorimonas sp.]
MTPAPKLAFAALIALAATAQTAQAKDWYLGGSIGYNAASDQTSEGPDRLVDVEYDDGFALSSYVGFRKTENLRFEGELAFRRNDGEQLAFNGVDRAFAGSGTESYSLLANVYYDFPTQSAITSYIGAGAGIGFLENDFVYGPAVFEDDDTAFVYQGIIGASLPVTDRIDLFLDGRYLGASGVDFTRTSPADNGVSLNSEYDNFTVNVGYRFNF